VRRDKTPAPIDEAPFSYSISDDEYFAVMLTRACILCFVSLVLPWTVPAMESAPEPDSATAESAPTEKAGKVVLVEQDQPRAQIVVPEQAVPVVQHAAEELQYHVRQATGVELPIVTEGAADPAVPHRIYLGDGEAARRAGLSFPGEVEPTEEYARNAKVRWRLKTVGGDLFLAGSDNNGRVGDRYNGTRHGTLFAVYEFLETELGVRWLWPGELGEVIPRREELVVGPLDREGMERFAEAEWYTKLTTQREARRWHSPEHWQNFAAAQRKWILRHRAGVRNTVTYAYGHYFERGSELGPSYIERFFKSRPDFFQQLPDGTRGYIPGMPEGSHIISMCVGNPDLHRQMIEDWRGYRQNELVRRGGKVGSGMGWMLNACENDTAAGCTCPLCRAMDAKDPRFENHDYWSGGVLVTDPSLLTDPSKRNPNFGKVRYQAARPDAQGRPAPSLTDRYARFYLALQKEAEKHDPSAVVFGYAYSNYVDPPVETKLNDRVVISMVPWPYFPWTDRDVREMKETWEKWHATGARLKLRPNTPNTGHNFPIFLARKIGEVFGHHYRHGAVATTFDALTGQWASKGPDNYVLMRMNVRPDWPVDKILDEYYAGFGPAEDAVRQYFEHWEQVSERAAKNPPASVQTDADDAAEGGGWAGFRGFVRHAPQIFPPEAMAKGRALIEKARAAAAGDPTAAQRVDFLDKGLRHAELTLDVARAKAGLDSGEEGAERVYEKAMADLQTYRRRVVEPEMLANVGVLQFFEEGSNGWQHDYRAPVDRSVLREESPVVDPSFESGMFRGKSGVGDGWYVLGASADFVVTHEDSSAAEPAEGNYVLQVVAQPRSAPGEFRLAQKIPVETSDESRRFEVSLMVKTDPGFQGRLLVTGDGIERVYIDGTDGQWREVVTGAEVPAGKEFLYLAVWMKEGTGTIQLDDVLCVAR